MRAKWAMVAGAALAVILVVALVAAGWAIMAHTIWSAPGVAASAPTQVEWPAGAERCYAVGAVPAAELCPQATAPSSAGILTIEQATVAAREYLANLGCTGFEVREVMEFSQDFYAVVQEPGGADAVELLVDKETGAVGPEYGPNMMWNAKYGMHPDAGMMGGSTGTPVLSASQAVDVAQRWLDAYRPGMTAEAQAHAFYGYYTIHTLRDGQIAGMLSVNASTGQVWYHNWHGEFIQMVEEPR